MESPLDKTAIVPRAGLPSEYFQPGDQVGQYRVEKVIGRGGMGVVYAVEHVALKKRFALKALPPALAKEGSFVARFKREAEMLARLKHRHIVDVTDFGEVQGKLYLVLEYIGGGSLEEWFERNRRPGAGASAAEVHRIIIQVLEGMQHAHAAGIIHRDLKPANILLEKSGEVKISDFGLARVVAEEEYRRDGGTHAPFKGDSVTTTGAIVGTIDFMSPEARNMRPSDSRSDIYAVGVITYYLLTGRKPHGLAQPASRLVPGLDGRWDKFISTCLAEDPASRYPKAAAALAALQEISLGGSSRRKLIAAVAALVVLGAVGAVAYKSFGGAVVAEPALQSLAPVVTEAPSSRDFAVRGLPPGAVLSIGEKTWTASPEGAVALNLPDGDYAITVRAAGFQDHTGKITVGGAAIEQLIAMLPLPPVRVVFNGLPVGATLAISGNEISSDAGAAAVELPVGRHSVMVRAPKYIEQSLDLVVEPGMAAVAVALVKQPPPSEFVVMLPNETPLKFRWIPKGQHVVGSPLDEVGRQRNDLPPTPVEFTEGFYVAETEMTQRQHRALTGRNPSSSRALGNDSRPVEQVSWRDLTGPTGAVARMNELLRQQSAEFVADLPTELEWEYACRAGASEAFSNGRPFTSERDDPALNEIGVYIRNRVQAAPSPVATKKPNAWGLFDMHGNISEWTLPQKGRKEPVLRGGNWNVSAVHCRSASRVEASIDTRATDVMGYRLILRPIAE